MAITGLLFHVCGEAVVNVSANRRDRQTDKERLQDMFDKLQAKIKTYKRQVEEAEEIAAV